MGYYLQAVGAVLLTTVLGLTLTNRGKEYGIVLTILVCCMVLVIAFTYLDPVLKFLQELERLADLETEMLLTLLKVVGIALLGEMSALICNDAGNSSLGKTLQILGSAVILWIAIPIFRSLINLLQRILGEL